MDLLVSEGSPSANLEKRRWFHMVAFDKFRFYSVLAFPLQLPTLSPCPLTMPPLHMSAPAPTYRLRSSKSILFGRLANPILWLFLRRYQHLQNPMFGVDPWIHSLFSKTLFELHKGDTRKNCCHGSKLWVPIQFLIWPILFFSFPYIVLFQIIELAHSIPW